MKKTFILLSCVFAVIAITANFACKKNTTTKNNSGDTDSVLINLGNNIILPSYQALAKSTNSLDSAVTDFNASPDAGKLANLQMLFKNAYVAYQSVSSYNAFGPAYSTQPTLSSLNLFPPLANKIDSNIIVGFYNINVFSNAGAKGFPAMDYMLFSAGNGTLANYTTDAKAANRKQYLATVSADIKAEVNAAMTAWLPSGGNYINTFISGTGNSVSSSLGLLINSFDQDFEILKNDCLGIPLGKMPPGSSLPVTPNNLEGYYSGISAQLALAQLKAAQSIYLGTTGTQGNGMGLSTYLVKANAKYNGGLLADTIKVDLAMAITHLQAIQDPMSTAIQSNPGPADEVFAELQGLVVLLKTDMPSSLGVLITYGDNDGD